jgi:uncharacterized membrane protein
MSEIPPPYTPPPSAPIGGGVGGSDRTLMLVLAYLGIFALIPLFVRKDDKEIQWHAKNGLVITVAWIILGILLGVISQMPFMGCAVQAIWCVYPLVILVVSIMGIVKAVNGQRFVIPGLSDFADKF